VKLSGIVSDVRAEDGVVSQFMITDESGIGALIYINAYITSAVDLQFIADGATVSVTGLVSFGENFGPDFQARIRVSDRSEIVLLAPAHTCDYALSARSSSTNLQNSTTVTITVDGKCDCGDKIALASASVKLKQQGTQKVKVGIYDVTVVVNGNNKITDIYIGTPPPLAGGGQNNNKQ